MPRLADYFVVVGYDYEKGRNGEKGAGKILQRFPEKDWSDCPFTQGIEMFCQPTGWTLSTQKTEPTFFVSALTDIEADRHYCACMTFSEDVVAMEPQGREDMDEEDMEQDIPPQFTRSASKMYAPKSLVIVSRLDYFDAFRNCLGIIYAVHVENMSISFETMIGNLLGCVQVPDPGGPQIRFSIGADDRQALQPPVSSLLPVTRSSVALLLEQLGITNTLTIFCAALSDHKVLFHSQSYTRLTESCHAITSLMFPLKYSYVYIPLLPVGLLEVLSTPTPFIAGVHTSLKPEVSELLDVVIGDLDGGSVKLPENVQLSLLPEPILSRTIQSLQLILRPELVLSDLAFPPAQPKKSNPEMLDKEIRAVFLRMFGELFFGYRSCLTMIRIHPEPVITFHKANFLGHRDLIDYEFVTRVLDSMSFNTFVAERGPPYRVCDIFDEVFSSMQDVLKNEESNPDRLIQNIHDLAQQLFQNENPTSQPYSQKIPRPTEGAHLRVHQPIFPHINAQKVGEIVEEGIAKQSIKNKLSPVWQHYPRIVPIGAHISASLDSRSQIVSTNARRLEVLRNCVNSIFEARISDARKIFPAVLRMLKSKTARLSLVEELSFHVKSNRAVLDHQQFDLVVRLLNSALQNDSTMDEYGVAADILPLATAFCRKLFTGVMQFAYTLIQEHAVWASLQFWEQTFYQDVQLQIRQLYLPQHEATNYPSSPKEDKDVANGCVKDTSLRPSDPKRLSSSSLRQRGISALEIAAEQMRIWPNQSKENQVEMIGSEESTVYSQAIHYANRIVYMRVPLDATKRIRDIPSAVEGESLSSMVTNSVAESDSYDAESGFEEQEVSEVGTNVTKFVSRFVDKVCAESGVNADHVKALHLMIPGVIAMHLETLEAVHQESRRLPPIQKPKILSPVLLPGEVILMDGLRVYLIPDGREEAIGGPFGGPILLPAEGALFLTTYRVIFKGTPCDPFVCEQIICRSFPISSLTKEKKLGEQCLSHINQWLHEAIQLRSCTFQLMKMAFDDEVSLDDVETFRKLLMKSRNPPSVTSTFAFCGGHVVAQPLQLHKVKEKNASLKGFAKRTLLKTARRAGIKPMKETKTQQQKFGMATPPQSRRAVSGIDPLGSLRHDAAPMFDDDLSVIDEQEIQQQIQNDAKNIDRLAERSYCRDYARLGLGCLSYSQSRARSEGYRLTMINTAYTVCQSYPAVLSVPQYVSDDSVLKFSRSHRQSRFPVATWRHPTTKAVLLRGSGFHGKGVMGMLKGHYNNPAGVPGVEGPTSVTIEQEKYFTAIVSTTPAGGIKKDQAFQRVLGSLRVTSHRESTVSESSAHDVTDLSLGRMTLTRRPMSAMPSSGMQQADSQSTLRQNGGLGDLSSDLNMHNLHKAALYILGEKTQIKGIRSESFKKCEFVPVDYNEIRHVKSSFKKLMRACLPSSPVVDTDQKKKGFLRAVEESGWLSQMQNILQIAGAAVDLLDAQGSSVMICLEDGWDLGTQVVSIAQLLLDPYYRTFEGFRILIEKEWLSFGHRFTHRSNQTVDTQASGYAPIFLQFLDVVHQIHSQFPLSFEFNQYYLKFLAYHHVSNRFRTFMMDNEHQRMEAGWLLDESKLNVAAAMTAAAAERESDSQTSSGLRIAVGMSIWEYIEKQHSTSTVFYNFLYSPRNTETVLRPYSNISSLKIWNYYVKEDLAHGPSYDLEVASKDTIGGEMDEEVAVEVSGGGREIVNACYDNVTQVEPDSFSYMLQEIQRLEQELYGTSSTTISSMGASMTASSSSSSSSTVAHTWKQTWDSVENQFSEQLARNASFSSTQLSRQHGRTVHKRSTMELLVKGRMLGVESSKSQSQTHRFERFNYTTPTYCDYCSNILWGFVKTGMHCADCGYNCHDKCAPHVQKNCSKMRPLSEVSASSTNFSGGNISDTASTIADVGGGKDGEAFLQFSSSTVEHRTHEGYLWKRGALLKGWKQRWFVLDTMKHQIRYYESHEDSSSKDCIELTDVVSVQSIKNVPGAPKKCDENAFFELRTSKRMYHFLALDQKAAQEWIDKLQLAIQ